MFNWRTNTDPVGGFSNRVITAVFTCAVVLAFSLIQCRAALASELTVHVQNSRGYPVIGATIAFGPDHPCGDPDFCGSGGGTDINGNWTGDPGSTFSVSRGSGWPEGSAGIAASSTSGNTTVTLPSLTDAYPRYVPTEPQLSDAERWMVGQFNSARAAVGVAPLRIAHALTRTSDMYAAYLSNSEINLALGNGHFQVLGPEERGLDSGWPDRYIGENIVANGPSPQSNFDWWMNSAGHRDAILDPGYKAVGVSVNSGTIRKQWVADFAVNTCTLPKCGMTNDFGDPNLNPGDGSGDGSGDDDLLTPSLKRSKLKSSAKRGKKLKFSVTVTRGDGIVRASFRKGRSKAGMIRKTITDSATGIKTYKFTTTPRKTGRWTLTIRFSGKGNWDDKVIVKHVRVRT